MAKKTRSVIIIEYTAARLFQLFILALPWKIAHYVGIFLGSLCYYLIASRRRILKENLSAAFPQMADSEIAGLSIKVWQSIGQTLIEFLKIPHLNKNNIDRYVTIKGWDNVKEAAAEGKGIISFGAHYFNWELISAAMSLRCAFGAVARPLENPLLNELVKNIRQTNGSIIIFHRNAIKEGLRLLKKGGVLGLLIDQHYGGGDVNIDFFGRKAATTPIVGVLANRTNAPVFPIKCYREKFHIYIEILPEVVFERCDDVNEFYLKSTQKVTGVIESWIRERPEGWFWVHRRWR